MTKDVKGSKSSKALRLKNQKKIYQAAKRLTVLHQGIREWVEFYHQKDVEFMQLYSAASEAVQLSLMELEYKIDPMAAHKEIELELNAGGAL